MLEWFKQHFFENAGSRIKRLALIMFVVEFFLEAIAAALGFIVLLFSIDDNGGSFLLTPFAFLAAVGASWLLTLPLYGFGELIEKTYEVARNTRTNEEEITVPVKTPAVSYRQVSSAQETNYWVCNCGLKNTKSSKVCKGCGTAYRSEKPPKEVYVAPESLPSKKCICGERFYGDECPLCGRKI